MKKFSAVLVVLVLSFPVFAGEPRDRERRDPRRPSLVKVLKKLFTIATQENQPVVPRP